MLPFFLQVFVATTTIMKMMISSFQMEQCTLDKRNSQTNFLSVGGKLIIQIFKIKMLYSSTWLPLLPLCYMVLFLSCCCCYGSFSIRCMWVFHDTCAGMKQKHFGKVLNTLPPQKSVISKTFVFPLVKDRI